MALPRLETVITADTKQAEAGFDRVEKGLRDVGGAADHASARTTRMGTQLARTAARSSGFSRGVQNASFQLGDFATQVGAGTSASIALGQQLPQLLGGFGVLGAVLGAVVAIGVPLTRVMGDISDQGKDMTSVFGTLQPVMASVADAMRTVQSGFIAVAEAIINNLDRVLITAGLVAGFFAGKYVAAFVAARIATFSLAGALTTLRGALIRTGIGALVIAAGELVFQFSRLVQATGGIVEAFGLVGSVGVEVWQRVKTGAEAMGLSLQAVFLSMQGNFLGAISKMTMAASDFFMSMSEGLADVPGMEALAGAMMGASDKLLRGAASASQSGQMAINAARERSGQAEGLFGDLSGPLESVQRMRELLAGIKEDRLTIPDLFGSNGEDDENPLKKQTDEQIESLRGLQEQGRATWGALGNFIGQFATKSRAAAIAQIAIQKGLAIVEILANSKAAAAKALNAYPGPVGAALAAKYLAFGKIQAGLVGALGLAQAAGAGGGGGGGAGGGAGGGGGAAAVAQAPQPLEARLTGFGPNDLVRGADVGELLERLNDAAGDRGFRLLVAS